MVVDLNQLETLVTQLEADTTVLSKIVNDASDAVNTGEEAGTVTTRLGDVVKNIQRVIADASSTAIGNPPVENEAADAYTAIQGDNRKYKRMTAATPITFTVNANVHIANDEFEIEQAGAGTITFAAGAGMTINSRGGLVASSGQYGIVKIKFISPTVAVISGDLTA